MPTLQPLRSFEQIKLLSDPRRLAILRLLMAAPATLTQLGESLGEHPAWVRHHLKQLETAGLVEIESVHIRGGNVEKYYHALAQAFFLHEVILPEPGERSAVTLFGSHDLALELLAARLRDRLDIELVFLPLGSLEGLIALRQGFTTLTGCHLLDPQSGEYNLPVVRQLFPDQPLTLITLAHRQQGLIVAPGNPKHIRTLEDLTRPDIILICRNPGSGTRLWLDMRLSQMGFPADRLTGHGQEAQTHTVVAQAVATGQADVGLGLAAAAARANLEFIPLFEERYDLALHRQDLSQPDIQDLFDLLTSARFRGEVSSLPGYDFTQIGVQLTA